MSTLIEIFKTGTRDSPLAVTQAKGALSKLQAAIPFVKFELCEGSSPGDRDQSSDLNVAAADFFTRDLDDGVLSGELDCAIHSAKDMVYPPRAGLEWFWLPWTADRRDALVLRRGETRADLSTNGVLGVSSERREAFGRDYLPGFEQRAVRGTIGSRLEQLDRGDFDVLIIAGAALVRLGLEDRLTEWIPLVELEPPEAQGVLGISFRSGDERLIRIRNFFSPAAYLAGAGPGAPDLCTLGAFRVLEQCDVCLYDALVSPELLGALPAHVKQVDVGKRSGAHYMTQDQICALMLDTLRQGKRVVRLKGGDPGMFGRLSEEVDALETAGFGYHVIPGVSSFQAATTGTGLLMTRRGLSRGVTLMTPRVAGGSSSPIGREVRAGLPLAFFMAVTRAGEIVEELQAEGRSGVEACTVVFNAGTSSEVCVHGTLQTLVDLLGPHVDRGPGLLLIGNTFREEYLYKRPLSPLEGMRVVLACSEALQDRASNAVLDRGGVPLSFPMIRVEPSGDGREGVAGVAAYDWLVLTSPSAVHVFFDECRLLGLDVRSLPKVMVCGSGTADALAGYHVVADHVPPSDFGRAGLAKSASEVLVRGDRVLRVRSDLAGEALSEDLRSLADVEVVDCVVYRTCDVTYAQMPLGDAYFFGSSSAAHSFARQFDIKALSGRAVVAIGAPTYKTLTKLGVEGCIVPESATVDGAITALGLVRLSDALVRLAGQST